MTIVMPLKVHDRVTAARPWAPKTSAVRLGAKRPAN